jgi:dTDP-4-dehydrorhamnose 3,5-epimerase-like enzyme
MDLLETALPEIKVVMPRRIGDVRGFFSEVWNARDFAAFGIDATAFSSGKSVQTWLPLRAAADEGTGSA